MELPTEYVKGECMEMCPRSEISLRQKESLLHVLEMLPGTEKDSKPVADKSKVVKCFARSAAGKNMLNPRYLRPPEVLLKTVNYLFEEVLPNKKVPWHVTYDFIMDRLRSVRQDMIIQNASVAESICILQPIVRFYAFATYKLCEEPIANFDPYINETHLQECLKRLLCLYDECNKLFFKKNRCTKSYCMLKLEETRPQFEALYLMLNLGNVTALTRVLTLPEKWRDGVVRIATSLSMNFYRNNFIKVCQLIRKMPVLLQGVAVTRLPAVRWQALKTMSVAYNSRNLGFPLPVLKDLLLYDDVMQATRDCVYYGLKCNQTEVQFVKADFDDSKAIPRPVHLQVIDQIYEKINIGNLILNG